MRTSAEPERSGVHRRQHRLSHAAAVRKQETPPCREVPQGERKADEGAGCGFFNPFQGCFRSLTKAHALSSSRYAWCVCFLLG